MFSLVAQWVAPKVRPARVPPSTSIPTSCLRRGQLRVVHAEATGLMLTVFSGRLWVTRDGDLDDHFLSAGDSLELRQQRVVLECDRAPAGQAGATYQLQPLLRE